MRRFLLLPLAVLLLSGCATVEVMSQTVRGSGDSGTRTERADGIHRLSLGAPGTLVIEVGRASDLRIEGDANLVERLEIERDGDELRIRTPRNVNFDPTLPLRYHVGVASLDGVNLAGGGRIEADGVDADAFEANVAGSGEIVIGGLRAGSVSVNIAGSGDATLDGTADAIEVNIAGSGNADVGDLAVRRAEVSIAGSGDVTLRAEDRLDVSIMGSGGVRYYGNPAVDRAVAGSGDVERLGD
jgi:hypothetical protein